MNEKKLNKKMKELNALDIGGAKFAAIRASINMANEYDLLDRVNVAELAIESPKTIRKERREILFGWEKI